jgi:hypothetical protein
MTARRVLLGAFILLVAGLVWFLWPRHDAATEPPVAAVPRLPAPPGTRGPAPVAPAGSAPAPAEILNLAADLNAPTGSITRDLQIILEVIETFRTNFPREGNPVGSNAEITAALTGGNVLRLALIAPTHPAINRAGELCDRWGTPFFFHAESARRMEVRSAGPDRKLWTDDDMVRTP